jgi:CheY-like chemotaxis protein
MDDQVKTFGDIAKGLARNPLGIIALFIVLVYGLAALVAAFAGSFTPAEKVPLVYFLVLFPVLVLIVFAWLVAKHSGQLFAPGDFRNEDNYVQLQGQLVAVASLAAASVKSESDGSVHNIEGIVEAVRSTTHARSSAIDGWRNRVLWVDDRPENNSYERQAFEAVGLSFNLCLSTNEALKQLSKERFAAIISDMGRKEGPREGYVLLDKLREKDARTPFFVYASSNSPEHKRETTKHGGQGCTNDAQQLFQMVMRSVIGQTADSLTALPAA